MAQIRPRFLQSDPCTETQEEDEAGPGKVEDFDPGQALIGRKSQLQELGTQPVHSATAVPTQALCWAFQSRSGSSCPSLPCDG
jgi:hypothetical protein